MPKIKLNSLSLCLILSLFLPLSSSLAKASFKFAMYPRMISNSWSSCVYLPSAWGTGMCHHARPLGLVIGGRSQWAHFEGYIISLDPFSHVLSASWSLWYETSPRQNGPYHNDMCLTVPQEHWNQMTIDWNLWDCELKHNFFLLLSYVFCRSNGKLTQAFKHMDRPLSFLRIELLVQRRQCSRWDWIID